MTFESVRKLVEENEKGTFLDTSGVLVKLANNLLQNPNEEKFRKIRIGNQTIQDKLLTVVGGMECLFEMGFLEDGEFLTFPSGGCLKRLTNIKSELETERSKLTQTAASDRQPSTPRSAVAQTTPAVSQPTPAVTQPTPNIMSASLNRMSMQVSERNFYSKIQSNMEHVLIYEDRALQEKALSIIPVSLLKKQAQEKLTDSLDLTDLILLELLSWFKNSFFKWIDAPECESCKVTCRPAGMVPPNEEEIRWGASRVENYLCTACGTLTRFPRYNNPGRLLDYRKGRCGEWANCFTLCCRALGFEARYVLDWTDHVWTEVYSISQSRWLHCDPCENVCDKPLLYESGWGKKLTYVLAFSKDEAQDVSWRYSAKHSELLSRRKECRETWLISVIHKIYKKKLSTMNSSRHDVMNKRLITEIVEFTSMKTNSGQQLGGRTTGSLAWRLARGETGEQMPDVDSKYVFQLTNSEKSAKVFHLRYSCAQDKYVRVHDGDSVINGWQKAAFSMDSIFRKVESDWKKAYLARAEGTGSGKLSWKFDFSD